MTVGVLTNEWYKVGGEVRMPCGRELLCLLACGRYRTARWNGVYWVDPVRNVALSGEDKDVVKWFMFERPGNDDW